MKTGLLLYLVLSLSLTSASGQQVMSGRDSSVPSGKMQELIRQSRIAHGVQDAQRLGRPGGILLPVATLRNPQALNAFLKTGTDKVSQPLRGPGVCEDSSGNRLISLENQQIYLISTAHTKDDGILMAGTLTDTTVLGRGLVYNAFLMKADKNGNVLWIKGFGDGAEAYSETEFNLVSELQSGGIIVTGRCFNTDSKQIGSELIARYNASGTLIWTKTYSSLIAVNSSISPVDFRSVTDGLNGDLLLSGTVMDNAGSNLIFTIVRMSGDGNVVWDVNHRHPGGDLGTEGLGAKLIAGKIVAVGLDHGSSLLKIPAAVEVLTLNYADGSLSNRRLFATNYSDSVGFLTKQFTYFYNHAAFQDNGHLIVYGAMYSDLARITTFVDHFGVMEFDAAFNLVTAYSVGSYLQNTSPAAVIHFDATGRGIFLVERNVTGVGAETFLGVLQTQQIASQRYKIYPNALLSNSGGFGENVRTVSFADGSFVLSQNLSQFRDAGLGGSFINFKKMHLSDTSSSCIGIDTLFSQLLPLNVVDKTSSGDYPNEILTKKLTPTSFNLSPQPAPAASTINGCSQTNYCDSLKIHGDTVFCSGEGPQIFSAFKNSACGAIVQWQLDSSFIASDSVLSDSSVRVRFKKTSGVTKIRATLPAGTCTQGLSDSLVIRIIATPNAPDFGPDTTLCGGNTILLRTEAGFASYLWQDGSTNADFTVGKPGRYFIAVGDACGNTLRDTIDITDAQASFSAGNDTVKCNDDSIRLGASGGFEHYTWSPAYNMDSSDARFTPAYPDVSTVYTVTAMRGTNCVVTTSVRVNVLHSNAIGFGGDTSLCMGSSLPLDAGPGFTGYLWSNGSRAESISVSAAGRYSVAATAGNGCVSQAALTVLKIDPAPIFSLASGADTTICDGVALRYSFTMAAAVYAWSDGSNSSDKSITMPGNYSLTISANGCAVTRSVNVSVKPTPAVDLGSDVFLCPGNTTTLDAVSSPGVTWRWQDGSTGAQYFVSRTGLYSVSVNLNGCGSSDSVMVTYLDKPKINLPKDTMICPGQTVLLNTSLKTQAGYLWQDGTTGAEFSAQAAGLYSVTTTNICGTDEASVQVIPGVCQILLPNAFTPNGDGKNDVFKIRYFFPVQSYHMKIFNRSGQLMFESSDMTNGWNGTLGAIDQPQGGYTWLVDLVSLTGEKSSARGVVILLR